MVSFRLGATCTAPLTLASNTDRPRSLGTIATVMDWLGGGGDGGGDAGGEGGGGGGGGGGRRRARRRAGRRARDRAAGEHDSDGGERRERGQPGPASRRHGRK